MNREFALIEKLKKRIPRTLQGLIPIGDDAGMITLAKRTGLLVSTDAIVEGVDFRMSGTDPALIGRKALAVNLSDMAAMAARPVAFVAAAGIPKGLGERWMLRFHEGMMRLAREYQVACLGGDLSRAREFFAAVTILGEAPKAGAVLRSGARPGDWI
ncbi:MAG: thiamine-phosphate kinase, partial [Candidatus Omnitrophota bacterium]